MNPLDDEQLHPGTGEKGREELYRFAWVDVPNNLCGASWIRFRIDRRQIDGAFVALRQGKLINLHLVRADRMNRTLERFRPQFGLPAGQMSLRMLQPWRHWQLTLLGHNHAQMDWQRSSGKIHGQYAASGSEPISATTEWTDQAGTLKGYSVFKKKEIQWSAPCFKQHEWGVPAWRRHTGWQRWTIRDEQGRLLSLYIEDDTPPDEICLRISRKGKAQQTKVTMLTTETTTTLQWHEESLHLEQIAILPWVREGSVGHLIWYRCGEHGLAFCEKMNYTGRRGYLGKWQQMVAPARDYLAS